MKKQSFKLIQLVADEGNIFYRKDDNTPLGRELFLGGSDSPDNYYEGLPPPVDATGDNATEEREYV